MKSHSKASPQRSCLAARSCWRFSPTSVTPASASAPISSSGTYLVAARISTSGAGDARAPARGWRATLPGRCRGSGPPRSALPRLDPGEAAPGGRCARRRGGGRRRAPARSWCRARPTRPARPRPRAAAAARPRAGRACRPSAIPSPRPREGGEHLLADLVAAGADPGADRGVGRADRLGAARRRSRPARPRQPQCSIATPAGPGERRPAGSRRRRRAPPAPGSAMTCPSTSATRLPGSVERARLLRPVVDARARRRGPGGRSATRSGAKPSAAARRRRFSTTAASRVVGEDAEVEAVEGRLADAAEAGREGGPSRPAQVGLQPADAVALAPLHRRLHAPPPAAQRASSSLAPGDLAVELAPQRRRAGRGRSPGPRGTPAAIRSSPSISSATSRHSSR